MSTEAHAEVHSREVDVVMSSRDGMTTAAELEWTTAETEREHERERRKTNAAMDTEKASTTPASRETQAERGHPAAHPTRASKDVSGRGHRSRSSKERRQEG